MGVSREDHKVKIGQSSSVNQLPWKSEVVSIFVCGHRPKTKELLELLLSVAIGQRPRT